MKFGLGKLNEGSGVSESVGVGDLETGAVDFVRGGVGLEKGGVCGEQGLEV